MTKTKQLVAQRDTLLVVRPIQSAVLIAEAKPNQIYKVSEGTVLDCARLDWWEGAHVSDALDGDDYWHPMLAEPIAGSPVLNWFAYAKHWIAKEDEHPQLEEARPALVDDEEKKTAASLIKSASNTAMAEEPSEDRVDDLGPTIQLPGKDFQRPRHLKEPIFWADGKPAPFTWGEMTANGTRIPETEAIAWNIVKVTRVLTAFREVFAQPIGITSGYRPPKINRQVGGARFSRHLEGDAVDWYPVVDDVCPETWAQVSDMQLGGGLAIGNGFFHTDCRGGGDVLKDYRGRTFWLYPNTPSWAYG